MYLGITQKFNNWGAVLAWDWLTGLYLYLLLLRRQHCERRVYLCLLTYLYQWIKQPVPVACSMSEYANVRWRNPGATICFWKITQFSRNATACRNRLVCWREFHRPHLALTSQREHTARLLWTVLKVRNSYTVFALMIVGMTATMSFFVGSCHWIIFSSTHSVRFRHGELK